jgi:SAM-dependent methyltransferase
VLILKTPIGNFHTLLTHPTLLFKQDGLTRFRRTAYSRLWFSQGSACSDSLPAPFIIIPLLNSVNGHVLEVGAGTGELLRFYNNDRISTICAIEPAEDMLDTLRERGRALFQEDHDAEIVEGRGESRFKVFKVGAQCSELFPALREGGYLEPGWEDQGVFDDIVCVRVLCMVPEFVDTVKGLYGLLKPGGRLIVCEHSVNSWTLKRSIWGTKSSSKRFNEDEEENGNFVARALQWIYSSLGWSFWMGDCHLERDMPKILKEAGKWREVRLQNADGWGVLPYTVGYLVKD